MKTIRTRTARPSSPVMKPRMTELAVPGETIDSPTQIIEVLQLDMSPAGQEWLVEEMAKVVEDERKPRPFCRDCADNNGVCPHTRRYCDPNKQTAFAILARLLSAQRQAKGGKGR